MVETMEGNHAAAAGAAAGAAAAGAEAGVGSAAEVEAVAADGAGAGAGAATGAGAAGGGATAAAAEADAAAPALSAPGDPFAAAREDDWGSVHIAFGLEVAPVATVQGMMHVMLHAQLLKAGAARIKEGWRRCCCMGGGAGRQRGGECGQECQGIDERAVGAEGGQEAAEVAVGEGIMAGGRGGGVATAAGGGGGGAVGERRIAVAGGGGGARAAGTAPAETLAAAADAATEALPAPENQGKTKQQQQQVLERRLMALAACEVLLQLTVLAGCRALGAVARKVSPAVAPDPRVQELLAQGLLGELEKKPPGGGNGGRHCTEQGKRQQQQDQQQQQKEAEEQEGEEVGTERLAGGTGVQAVFRELLELLIPRGIDAGDWAGATYNATCCCGHGGHCMPGREGVFFRQGHSVAGAAATDCGGSSLVACSAAAAAAPTHCTLSAGTCVTTAAAASVGVQDMVKTAAVYLPQLLQGLLMGSDISSFATLGVECKAAPESGRPAAAATPGQSPPPAAGGQPTTAAAGGILTPVAEASAAAAAAGAAGAGAAAGGATATAGAAGAAAARGPPPAPPPVAAAGEIVSSHGVAVSGVDDALLWLECAADLDRYLLMVQKEQQLSVQHCQNQQNQQQQQLLQQQQQQQQDDFRDQSLELDATLPQVVQQKPDLWGNCKSREQNAEEEQRKHGEQEQEGDEQQQQQGCADALLASCKENEQLRVLELAQGLLLPMHAWLAVGIVVLLVSFPDEVMEGMPRSCKAGQQLLVQQALKVVQDELRGVERQQEQWDAEKEQQQQEEEEQRDEEEEEQRDEEQQMESLHHHHHHHQQQQRQEEGQEEWKDQQQQRAEGQRGGRSQELRKGLLSACLAMGSWEERLPGHGQCQFPTAAAAVTSNQPAAAAAAAAGGGGGGCGGHVSMAEHTSRSAPKASTAAPPASNTHDLHLLPWTEVFYKEEMKEEVVEAVEEVLWGLSECCQCQQQSLGAYQGLVGQQLRAKQAVRRGLLALHELKRSSLLTG